jgi:hypothetical protein
MKNDEEIEWSLPRRLDGIPKLVQAFLIIAMLIGVAVILNAVFPSGVHTKGDFDIPHDSEQW